MSDLIEISYRTQTKLIQKEIQGKQKMLCKIVYEDLLYFFDLEKCITGTYLRGKYEQISNTIFSFPAPQGKSLKELIKQNNEFSRDQLIQILNQLIIGLYQIHKNQILARCFNTENIYYDGQNITMMAFGFYCELQILPPEMFQKKNYSINIDSWLIGCILYELCTKESIPKFNDFKEYQIFFTKIERLNIQQQFKNIIKQLLEPNELQRISFLQLHNNINIINSNDQMRKFYYSQIKLQDIAQLINKRESIDQELLTWAIPIETQQLLVQPQHFIPFYFKKKLKTAPLYGQPKVNNPDKPPSVPISPIQRQQQQILTEPIESLNLQTFGQPQLHLSEMHQNTGPEANFLQFRIRDQIELNRYFNICIEIHFWTYKFHMITFLRDQLGEFESNFTILLAKYSLQKLLIILQKEFLNIINQGELDNILKTEWDQFVQKSGQLKTIKKDLKGFQILEQSLLSDYFVQINKYDFNQLNDTEKKLYQQVKQQVTETANEIKFEEFKIPYRKCLTVLFQDFQLNNEEDINNEMSLFNSKVQLRIIICMVINSIFASENGIQRQLHRNNIFEIIKNKNQITNMNNPYYIEDFINNSTKEELDNLIQIIKREYFGRNN